MWWTSWIKDAESFAYGQLGLNHRQFWDLTPAEFDDLRNGYYRRRRAHLEDMAHLVTVIVNSMPMRGRNARTLKVDHILGPSEEAIEQLKQERKMKRRKLKAMSEDA